MKKILELLLSKTLFMSIFENLNKVQSTSDFIFVLRFAYSAQSYFSFYSKNKDIIDEDTVVCSYSFNGGVYDLVSLIEIRND